MLAPSAAAGPPAVSGRMEAPAIRSAPSPPPHHESQADEASGEEGEGGGFGDG